MAGISGGCESVASQGQKSIKGVDIAARDGQLTAMDEISPDTAFAFQRGGDAKRIYQYSDLVKEMDRKVGR